VGDLDTSAVKAFGEELRGAGPKVRRKVSGSLTRYTNKVTATARSNVRAQSEDPRPWLADEGIQRDTRTMSRRIYSPPDLTRADGKPRNVGMHQELGTEGPRPLPPRPFLVPALAQHGDAFVADVTQIAETAV